MASNYPEKELSNYPEDEEDEMTLEERVKDIEDRLDDLEDVVKSIREYMNAYLQAEEPGISDFI